jgi:1-deoxy-D-xylulose-5-phosphate reductoisomerase
VRTITVLGSTGSIGVNTLDVVARYPDRFAVFALTANGNDTLLIEQCRRVAPKRVVLADVDAAQRCRAALRELGLDTEVSAGAKALEEVAAAPEVDTVMAAIVGAAGLVPTLAAARAGKRVLLANKEALVMSGRIFMDTVRTSGAELLPIDSEHNAIFQALPRGFERDFARAGIRKVTLTASGGPFRTWPIEALVSATPEQACRHPNWRMGRKISVDSATMMNKGLEVIEAHWLFEAAPHEIDIVVHPESIVHSMVAYADGSVIAQLSHPDMRTPIAHALAFPERIEAGVPELDLAKIGKLTFEPLDHARFPCVDLAYQAIDSGATASLNAANEIAVDAFLKGMIAFTAIAQVIENTLARAGAGACATLEEVLHADRQARDLAQASVRRLALRAGALQ